MWALPALAQAGGHLDGWSTTEATAGLHVPIVGDDVRWQLDAGWLHRRGATPVGHSAVFHTMLQAGF